MIARTTRRLVLDLESGLFNRMLAVATAQRKSLREVIEDAIRAYLRSTP